MTQGIGLDIHDVGELAGVRDGYPGWGPEPRIVGPAKFPADRNRDSLLSPIGGKLIGRKQPVLVADVALKIVVAAPCQGEQDKKGDGGTLHAR